jgi:hypothetical protein
MPRLAAALALAGVATFGVTGVTQSPAAGPKPSSPPLTSPDGKVKLTITVAPDGRLTWSASLEQTPVIEPSPLGIVVDGINLGVAVQIDRGGPYRVDERYDWRGVHSKAVNSWFSPLPCSSTAAILPHCYRIPPLT